MKNIFIKMRGSKLISGSLIIFAGTMISNISAYLYHLVTGRILGPVVYGELASLISLLYLFGVATGVLQTALSKYYAELKASNDDAATKWLMIEVTKYFTIVQFVVGLVIMLNSSVIAGYLHIDNPLLVTLSYLAFAVSSISMALGSFLQGYQFFVWAGVFIAIQSLLRFLISYPASYYGLTWVLVAWLISGLVSIFLPIPIIAKKLSIKPKKGHITIRTLLKFSAPTFFTFLGVTSLYTTDIVLVKHFFPSDIAGEYGALAVLGKIIFYATSSLGIVIVPTIAERKKINSGTRKVMLYSILGLTVVSLVFSTLYFLFPGIIVSMLFGVKYLNITPYLGIFSIFITLYSIGYILMMALLAAGKTGIFYIPVTAAMLQIVFIYIWHSNLYNIIYINILLTAVFSVLLLVYSVKSGLFNNI